MKNLFILISLFSSSLALAATCPDLTGKWLIQGGNPSRWQDVLVITQQGCQSIDFSWMQFTLNGVESRQAKMPNYPYVFAGTVKNDGSIELYEKRDSSTKACSPFQYWILRKSTANELLETNRYINCDGSVAGEEQVTYSLIN